MFKFIYLFIITQGLIYKVQVSQCQAAVHQYMHITGPKGYQSLPYTTVMNQPHYREPEPIYPQAKPIPYPGVAQTWPAMEETKPPELPKKNEASTNPKLDKNLLNNLAIALQLLIVSNILNTQDGAQELILPELPVTVTPKQELPVIVAPKQELAMVAPVQEQPIMISPKPEVPLMVTPKPEQQGFTVIYKPYDQTPVIISPYDSSAYTIKYENSPSYSDVQTYYIKDPNGSYLPAGYMEPSVLAQIGPTKATTARNTMTLMSPYEALGSTLETIGPIKRDLQSPYASILSDNNDLFSISDLF